MRFVLGRFQRRRNFIDDGQQRPIASAGPSGHVDAIAGHETERQRQIGPLLPDRIERIGKLRPLRPLQRRPLPTDSAQTQHGPAGREIAAVRRGQRKDSAGRIADPVVDANSTVGRPR